MKDNVPVLYSTPSVGTKVTEYSDAKSSVLPEALNKYHDQILSRDDSFYTISKFQAKALRFIAKMVDAKRVLEVGVYVGFSAMVWASGTGPDGKVVGLEFDEEYAEQAREGVRKSGFSNIEIITGNAQETLPALDVAEPFDIVFLDANKASYPFYLQTIIERSKPGSSSPRLLRPGGLIVADNVLRQGLVADFSEENPAYAGRGISLSKYTTPEDLAKLEEFNTIMATHERLESLLLPLYDGVGLARLVD